MPEQDTVLFANEAFYLAITSRDMEAMTRIWARDPVSCLHPGWAALIGRLDVLASWKRILSHDAAPNIICRQPRVLLHGEIAAVVCYEEIEGEFLVATNLFRREDRHWHMIHHQAGPTAAQFPPEDPPLGGPRPN
jgi:hypothetical protein